jgi:hypothetical protein
MPPSISLAVPGHRHLGDASVGARLLPIHRVGNLLIPYTKPIWVRRVLPSFVISHATFGYRRADVRVNKHPLYIGEILGAGATSAKPLVQELRIHLLKCSVVLRLFSSECRIRALMLRCFFTRSPSTCR